MQDYSLAHAYVTALTGLAPEQAIIDVRMIHDQDKSVPAIPRRGLLPDLWPEVVQRNNAGYGVFININELDGNGRELTNVATCRTHVVDLDNVSASVNYERACKSYPAPNFAVQSSPGKYHVYWSVTSYSDHVRYSVVQRKLRIVFDGDPKIIDASRILRLPGTLHCKGEPHLVTCHALPGYGNRYDVDVLETALASVSLDTAEPGSIRHDLGNPDLAAPSLEWLEYALGQLDPNELDRAEWISVTSAFKQAGWSLADEPTLFEIWSRWCARYERDDAGENTKQWNSIKQTQVGWPSFTRRVATLTAALSFGLTPAVHDSGAPPQSASVPAPPSSVPVSALGNILDAHDQSIHFKDCFFISRFGQILSNNGLLMGPGQFNGEKGGKIFTLGGGKHTDEAWKAATRNPEWTIPKVEDICFRPDEPFGNISVNSLGHKGVNTYRKPNVVSAPGDISPFLKHIEKMLPVASDRDILFSYIAHNVKFPGFKIPWAPLIQSAEGTGKGKVIKDIITYMLSEFYVYAPSAKELVDGGGSKFNSWMRGKLMIIVDEIRTDERRDMIEVLKPWITEPRIEIQGKGQDQCQEDNCANWLFFSNYKDAIPIGQNSRRFSVFYSALQSADDIARAGFDDDYFARLLGWLSAGGFAHVADWFMNYPIERGKIPMRAPFTSSQDEVMRQSRGPIDCAILDAIEDNRPGFRGGYVSMIAALRRVREATGRNVAPKTIQMALENYGYVRLGRAVRAHFDEDMNNRTELYGARPDLSLEGFGDAQGYMR